TCRLNTTHTGTGHYSFSNLLPGTYTPTAAQSSRSLHDALPICTPGGNSSVNDVFSAIALNAGVAGTNNNFGELAPASLAGFVYSDAKNDATKGRTETGISGVPVTLTGTDDRGAVNRSTLTTGTGAYSFATLPSVPLPLPQPQPSVFPYTTLFRSTPGGNSSVNDVFSAIALSAGVVGANNNFGELAPASLAGFVYS